MVIARIVLLSFCECLVLTDIPQICSVTPAMVPCSRGAEGSQIVFNATSGHCSYAPEEPVRLCVSSGHVFHDYTSCIHACLCSQPPPENRCPEDSTRSPSMSQRWFFNHEKGVCTAFTNYGCVDHSAVYWSGNSFFHESACKQKCVCTKPLHIGIGDLNVEAYAFNVRTKRCDRFVYKGQGGNANRFATNEECMDQCLCGLEEQDGSGDWTCGAYFETWVYYKDKNRCKRFMYGGCGGNSNLFFRKDMCSASCVK